MTSLEFLLAAWIVEVAIGWPAALYRRIRHPVVWLGSLVQVLETRLNRPAQSPAARRCTGAAVSLLCIALAGGLGAALDLALEDSRSGQLFLILSASSLLASRSLYDHVEAVARPLRAGDLATARRAVSAIVGRDCESLDEAGVARAALESLAENASDGVVAPLFWGLLLGLPGLAAYKAINTLDSMLGHRNERLRDFGAFAARLDDVANVLPARLTGWLVASVSWRRGVLQVMYRDAPLHRSPNAGWPEAAMAAALGIRLAGPRRYRGEASADAWLNAAAPDPGAEDLSRGLALYRRALGLLALGAIIGALGGRL